MGLCIEWSRRYLWLVAVALILAGCGDQLQQALPVCPGKESAAAALSVFRKRVNDAVPLRANGRCLLEYEEDGKPRQEQFPVKLWWNPPGEIYLQGDIAFDPRAVVLGANKDEFWLAIRLKEVSSYWWGRWTEAGSLNKLLIDPKVMLEGLGIPAVGSQDSGDWSFTKDGAFDVLTQSSDQASLAKKIYVYSCDYLIRKIEYLDVYGQPAVTAEMDEYEQIDERWAVPRTIKIIRNAPRPAESATITLNLTSVTSMAFTNRLREHLFRLPGAKGFKHKYRVIGGNIIEEPSELEETKS